PGMAEIVANAMKDWAIERGATHYTHWFQPLTGVTAEKHDSFISPSNGGSSVIMEFSGKELAQGEPDASSFPNGGSRSTFEARGYTAWDATSPAYIKEDKLGGTLYIPTAFYSYTGDALDKKTPLLRSNEAIGKASLRILRLFGNTTSKRVQPAVGPEQEYFLIDNKFYNKRLDIQLTGRTLFGNKAPKGHELDDHYFGSIKERVADFMSELDFELWKLGVAAKTRHNEVAPGQFELAAIYNNVNISTDQNQLVMDVMLKLAKRHDMTCLLHPKPFAGINGSGKHNNWSLATNDGYNLLEPGNTPEDNAQFLLFLMATIKAVDDYADLLRLAAADPGNDYRLGGHEAPPAIISIFLGDQLTDILENIEQGKKSKGYLKNNITVGVSTLPPLPKDATDRNRTSPFAFTGNKFEFRMVGSSSSLSRPNMIINTIVAKVLNTFADELEECKDLSKGVHNLIAKYYKAHKRVIFNGDGYSNEWYRMALSRKLPILKTMPDAVKAFMDEKNVKVFEDLKVLSKSEMTARYLVFIDIYIKQNMIEANTMISMAEREIIPAALKNQKSVSDTILSLTKIGLSPDTQMILLKKFNAYFEDLISSLNILKDLATEVENIIGDGEKTMFFIRDEIIPSMNKVRTAADGLESLCDAEIWPLPTYAQMLFDF
ncbi:MAG: glutamine synthetase III, partial [Candidatus Marinimicrobia bacterium]|nr:glutamine synthetase III [Candidatus Neomarinimicrobiota bacterium]